MRTNLHADPAHMNIGVEQADITPPVGVELSGFIAREQPSTGILDRLHARALYLEEDSERLLWIHSDLIGFQEPSVSALRDWIQRRCGLGRRQIILSATHTHCGPATVHLLGCGRFEDEYVQRLLQRIEELSERAMYKPQPCRLVVAEGALDLAVDRRSKPTSAVDPRVGALGWVDNGGSFIAAAVVYSMHAVALGAVRHISADWPGRASATLSALLPGKPVVLVSPGACGNINTPQCGAPLEAMHTWGDRVAEAAVQPLLEAQPVDAALKTAAQTVELPLDVLSPDEVNACAESLRRGHFPKPRQAAVVREWQRCRLHDLAAGQPDSMKAELSAVRIGPVILLGVNAEVFVQFTTAVCERTGQTVYTLGYCNGLFGYLPTRAAFDEGGYEPEFAHLYYNTFPLKAGALETLIDAACEMIGTLNASA